MGTNFDPLIADLFLYCYQSMFMAKLHMDPSRTDFIEKGVAPYSAEIWDFATQ